MFIISDGDKKAVAKDRLLWATIALFVMVSFWGILKIVNTTFFSDELGKGSYTVDHIYEVPESMTGKLNTP